MVISTEILAGPPSKPIARQLDGHNRVAQYFLSPLTPGAVLRVFYRITVVGQYVNPPESGQAFFGIMLRIAHFVGGGKFRHFKPLVDVYPLISRCQKKTSHGGDMRKIQVLGAIALRQEE
jgi:hypothetical protein